MQSGRRLRIAAGLTVFQAAGMWLLAPISRAAITVFFVAALWPSASSAQTIAPLPPPRVDLTELQAYATRFTGPNPLDCGQHMTRGSVPVPAKDLQRSLACAYDAAKARRSFWTLKQEHGIDSVLYQGLLGTPEGTIHQFWYDSAPCGGPACAGRFSVSRCNILTVLDFRSGKSDFGCDDANPRRFSKPKSPIPNPQSLER